jgi:hypothetical protein
MSQCIGQPVSWLALERHALGELPVEEGRALEDHLARCPACRACREQLGADTRDPSWLTAAIAQRTAAEVRRPRPPRRSERQAGRPSWLTLAGACAALLLGIRLGWERGVPGAQTASGVKGAELALSVVRLDAQGRLLEPRRFAAADRFKLLLTCPPTFSGPVRVLIFQGGELFEPVPEQGLRCGNRVALAGAWQLDGAQDVEVCAVLGGERASGVTAAAELRARGLAHACERLSPE